ncbi:MAG: HEAT repeat domain-containing protein [Deltaproteobacteria bacterium]|nr:HEAT repeat domain-containing protein [Deltaproteobacteria bacterium]
MPNRRSFKTDESFLEKLAIGAIGTRAVFADLTRQGHRPIELERGSMNYKIWKNIKIKRLRVPDILCLNCATRIEARAKTHLEISMSHSVSDPERGWDKGLSEHDIVAFSICKKVGKNPVDWEAKSIIQYVPVSKLKKTFAIKQVIIENPKGAGEGFELRVTWPSAVASEDGTVSEVTSSRLKFKRESDNRIISLSLIKKDIPLHPLVRPGDNIVAGQIVASVLHVSSSFTCKFKTTTKTFLKMLKSSSVADRYTAAKALFYFSNNEVNHSLQGRIDDTREHIYVKLESAASLARSGKSEGIEFIKRILHNEYLEHQLEAIIILGEMHLSESQNLLTMVLLDKSRHPEIRAGAAWALGELKKPESIDALIQTFTELDEPIRIEAVRALRKISETEATNIISRLSSSNEDQRAGIAWALSKSGHFVLDDLIRVMVDDNARRWVAYILGMQNKESVIGQIETLRNHDPEVYFAVTVLWKIIGSWIYDVEEY